MPEEKIRFETDAGGEYWLVRNWGFGLSGGPFEPRGITRYIGKIDRSIILGTLNQDGSVNLESSEDPLVIGAQEDLTRMYKGLARIFKAA